VAKVNAWRRNEGKKYLEPSMIQVLHANSHGGFVRIRKLWNGKNTHQSCFWSADKHCSLHD
jgi:hypothetical protein